MIRDSDYHTFCTPLLFLHQSKTAGAKWILTWVSYRKITFSKIKLHHCWQFHSTSTPFSSQIPGGTRLAIHMATSTSSRDGITGTHLNQILKKKTKFQPYFSRKWNCGNRKTLLLFFWGKGGPGFPLKKNKRRFHELLKEIDRLMVFDGDK